jgi:hypothetical protein
VDCLFGIFSSAVLPCSQSEEASSLSRREGSRGHSQSSYGFSSVIGRVRHLFSSAMGSVARFSPFSSITTWSKVAFFDDNTKKILGFYRGNVKNDEGLFLSDILKWDDSRLELTHTFIQWLFPIFDASQFNESAPILNSEVVQAFQDEPILRENLLKSFECMLRFYGLEIVYKDSKVKINRAFNIEKRQKIWLNQGNHNYLRITRILTCLRCLGFFDHAAAFYEILCDIAKEEGKDLISTETQSFWLKVARTELATVRE